MWKLIKNLIYHQAITVLIVLGCLFLTILLWLNFWPNPVLIIRFDLGTLLLILVVFGLIEWVWLAWTRHKTQEQTQDDIKIQAVDNRQRFLQRLHHELKNPLTTIRAGITNLHSIPHTQISQNSLTTIENETVRLNTLITNLQKLAELEVSPLEQTIVTVEKLLQEVVEFAQERTEAQDRLLILHPFPQAPGPLPSIFGDYDLLSLAIFNLLTNALKFTRSGDRIEVRASEDGRMVIIEVADTGIGIPETDLPHVWEELYRGQEASTTSGSGLGLTMVKIIVERHRGQVTLRSPKPQGTVVTVQLPAAL